MEREPKKKVARDGQKVNQDETKVATGRAHLSPTEKEWP